MFRTPNQNINHLVHLFFCRRMVFWFLQQYDVEKWIEPLSPGSTDKDWKPVPEILNPRRVLDFYLQPTYLSATSFHLRRSMILVLERTIFWISDLQFWLFLILVYDWAGGVPCGINCWGPTRGLSQNANLRCTGKFSCVVIRSEFLWKLSSCTLLNRLKVELTYKCGIVEALTRGFDDNTGC